MIVAICTHKSMLKHVPADSDEVEVPDRIRAVLDGVSAFERYTVYLKPRRARKRELRLGHANDYIEALSKSQLHSVGEDTFVSTGTADAALFSAGCVLQCMDEIMSGNVQRAFAVVRPPGHHAAASGPPRGFCFLGNAALACIKGVRSGYRVAIVDLDVHYGDGTRDILENMCSEDFLMCSIHRQGIYPHDPRGAHCVHWPFVNHAFKRRFSDSAWKAAISATILPQLRLFQPDIIIGSYGFDACEGDPLGECKVKPSSFETVTTQLLKVCPNLLITLEGGYNLQNLTKGARSVMRALIKP